MDGLLRHLYGNLRKNSDLFYVFKSLCFHPAIQGFMLCQSKSRSFKASWLNFFLITLMWSACRDLFIAWGQFKELLLCHPSWTLYLDLAGPGQNLLGNVTVVCLCWTYLFRSFCCHLLCLLNFHSGSSVLLWLYLWFVWLVLAYLEGDSLRYVSLIALPSGTPYSICIFSLFLCFSCSLRTVLRLASLC